MAIDYITVILASFVAVYIASFLCYYYGKQKGREQAAKIPNMTYPSISDVTIIGKYVISKQATQQIATTLNTHLARKGYAVGFMPNVIKITNRLEPEKAQKKKNYFDKLSYFRNGYPAQLNLYIYDSDPDSKSLVVVADCLPVMAQKMGQSHQFIFAQSHVEDAQRLCKDLMSETMCILNAKTLVEPYIESTLQKENKIELIYNTPSISNINEKVHEIIANSKSNIRIAGWVDREFLGDLEAANARGLDIQIITKNADASDKTIKDDFGRLIKIFGKRVRINSRFHDRFLICDDNVIIGSMYFVSASKTRYESTIFSDNKNVLNALKQHFEQIWDDPNSIVPQ